MKKLILLGLSLVASLGTLLAQETVSSEGNVVPQEQLKKPPMAVFTEIYGAGVNLASINFDSRFKKAHGGLGWRAGISYSNLSDVSLLTIPVGLNYLLGKNGKYFEVGVGATAMFSSTIRLNLFSSSSSDSYEKGKKSHITGTLTLGYRSQPVKGGFLFGVGITPIFGSADGEIYFFPLIPYVKLGYTF